MLKSTLQQLFPFSAPAMLVLRSRPSRKKIVLRQKLYKIGIRWLSHVEPWTWPIAFGHAFLPMSWFPFDNHYVHCSDTRTPALRWKMADFLAGETAHTHSFTLGLASFVEKLRKGSRLCRIWCATLGEFTAYTMIDLRYWDLGITCT